MKIWSLRMKISRTYHLETHFCWLPPWETEGIGFFFGRIFFENWIDPSFAKKFLSKQQALPQSMIDGEVRFVFSLEVVLWKHRTRETKNLIAYSLFLEPQLANERFAIVNRFGSKYGVENFLEIIVIVRGLTSTVREIVSVCSRFQARCS